MGRTTRRLLWLLVLLGPACLVSLRGGGDDMQGHAVQVSHETQPRAGGRWHQVKTQQNLREIAVRYYGSSHHWRLLQLSNDVGMYPKIGKQIWIPASADALFAEDDFAATLVSEVADLETMHTP